MSIPDYQSLMLPLLTLTSDGQEHHFPDLVDALSVEHKLTDFEKRVLLPSGSQFLFANRVGWARTYMKKAGLISAPKRGVVQITDRGKQVLKKYPDRIDNGVLRQFPEFLEFQSAKGVNPLAPKSSTLRKTSRRAINEFRSSCRLSYSLELKSVPPTSSSALSLIFY